MKLLTEEQYNALDDNGKAGYIMEQSPPRFFRQTAKIIGSVLDTPEFSREQAYEMARQAALRLLAWLDRDPVKLMAAMKRGEEIILEAGNPEVPS